MKEIDFLPDWYKSGRRRKFTYRAQYVALAGILVIMVVWNFLAAGSISRAEAELARITAPDPKTDAANATFNELKDQITALQKQAALIAKVDSRIDVASVLGELSALIGDSVVLSKVELVAERFGRLPRALKARRSAAVRVTGPAGRAQDVPLGQVKFKVVIAGVAADAADVAALICRLEDSAYFFQVVPMFSRDRQISPPLAAAAAESDRVELAGPQAARTIDASEFEISCYLANYRQEK